MFVVPNSSIHPYLCKFVETKYHLDLNATAASQLRRAIVAGNEKGTFVLPKGLLHPSYVPVESFLICSYPFQGPRERSNLLPRLRRVRPKRFASHDVAQ